MNVYSPRRGFGAAKNSKSVENRHYVTDTHATVLHQLGLDSRRLEIPDRKRLEMEHGRVIHDILA